MLSVSPTIPPLTGEQFTEALFRSGDITDDKFFRKVNDSDASQFALLFPRIGAHGTHLPPDYSRLPPLNRSLHQFGPLFGSSSSVV
jgi:hypothetical protein